MIFGGLLTFGIAGCGQESQPELGAGVAAPVGVTTTSTTTIPTTTTPTIDFNRPVTQGSAPLSDDADLAEIVALVSEIRGQSDDISTQIERLAPFLDLGAPPVAQITDIEVTLAAEQDAVHPSTATVRFRTPEPGADVVRATDNEFESLGWFTNDVSRREVDGGTITDSVFRTPGVRPDELEFRASIEDVAGPTMVEFTYVVEAEDDDVEDEAGDTYFDRLSAWQDALSPPRAAELTEVGVETADDAGTIFARYLLNADDEAEAVALVVAATVSGDFELLGASPDDQPTAGPLRLVDGAGAVVVIEFLRGPVEDSFTVEASHSFTLAPLD